MTDEFNTELMCCLHGFTLANRNSLDVIVQVVSAALGDFESARAKLSEYVDLFRLDREDSAEANREMIALNESADAAVNAAFTSLGTLGETCRSFAHGAETLARLAALDD